MQETNDTNIIVSGSGTASDPYTYHFHTAGQSYYGSHWLFYALVIAVGLAAAAGFLLGFYFGKRQKSN